MGNRFMRGLTLALSLLTLLILASNYFESAVAVVSTSKPNAEIKAFDLIAHPEELSVAEKAWLKLKEERNQKNLPTLPVENKKTSQKTFQIGEQNYMLFGIFDDANNPFILLKDETGKVFKLAKGDQLGQEATLVSFESSGISFDRSGELIEFKLFERKK